MEKLIKEVLKKYKAEKNKGIVHPNPLTYSEIEAIIFAVKFLFYSK